MDRDTPVRASVPMHDSTLSFANAAQRAQRARARTSQLARARGASSRLTRSNDFYKMVTTGICVCVCRIGLWWRARPRDLRHLKMCSLKPKRRTPAGCAAAALTSPTATLSRAHHGFVAKLCGGRRHGCSGRGNGRQTTTHSSGPGSREGPACGSQSRTAACSGATGALRLVTAASRSAAEPW